MRTAVTRLLQPLAAILFFVFAVAGSAMAAPSVTSIEPLDGASVPAATTVKATFSEAMNPASITTESFTLSRFVGVKAIAAGGSLVGSHTVALKNDGTVVAWGDNGNGQATVPAGLAGVTDIAAGGSHTVALKIDGTVVAWGYNYYHQTDVPVGLAGVIAIAAGGNHTVALKNDGTVVAWGDNFYHQTDVPADLTGVTAIAAGGYHTVALKGDGTVVAWGDDNKNRGQSTVPAGLAGVVAIAAGGSHTVALKNDGTVAAWGYDFFGQSTVPAELAGVTAIAAGGYHTVALKSDGTVAAWGYDNKGQSTVPEGLAGVVAIAAGFYHTVALKNDGTVAAWGDNGNGQATAPPLSAYGNAVSGSLSYDPATLTATFTPSAPLEAGDYDVAVTGASSQEGIPLAAPVEWSFTADTVAPDTTITAQPANPTNATSASFFFTSSETGSTFECSIDGGEFAPCTSPASYPGLAADSHSFSVKASDLAGNTDATPASYSWTIDTTPPDTTITAQPSDPTNATSAGFSFTSSKTGSTFECGMDGGAFAACTSPASYPGLSAGSHVFTVKATDPLGNSDATPAACSWTIDTLAPSLTVSTLSDGSHTSNATLNVAGSATDLYGLASFSIAGAAVAVGGDGAFSHAVTLAPGPNTITVEAVDQAGNRASDSRTVTLDQTLPAITITAPADNSKTAGSFVTVTGTIDEPATVTVKDNAGSEQAAAMDGNGFSATVNLAEGINTIEVTATDLAANTSTAKRTVTSDRTAPSLDITDPSEDTVVRNGQLTLQGTVSDALTAVTLSVTVDGTTYTPTVNENGNFDLEIALGNEEKIYPVTVTATDELGHATSVTRNVIYSRGTIVINRNAATTAATAATLSLNYWPSASKMQFLVNNRAWTAWGNFSLTKTVTLPAGDGLKTVSVRFQDEEGNVSIVYSDTIILDTRAPRGSVAIDGGAAVTTSPDVTLTLSVSDATSGVEMQVSESGTFAGAAWEPLVTTKPFHLTGALGRRTVYARFRDAGRKVSAATSDTILYQQAEAQTGATGALVINGGDYTSLVGVTLGITPPAGATHMSLSSNGATWGGWVAAASTKPFTLSAGDGVKTVYVKFKNAGGVESEFYYSDSIILDTRPPVGTVSINGGAYSTKSSTVNLNLTAADVNGVAWMQFSVNGTYGTEWEQFSTTKTLDLLPGDGIRKVLAKYKDAAGKISSACSDTIIVDTRAPVGSVKINAGAATTTDPDVTLAITATGYPVSMQVSVDGGATWGGWEPFARTRAVTLAGGAGENSVSVKLRDVTGNVSQPCSDTIMLAQ